MARPRATLSAVDDVVVGDRNDRDDVDRLFRDAVAISRLLESLDADDHRIRSDLLLARDDIRARAARMWADRGWRPITDDR